MYLQKCITTLILLTYANPLTDTHYSVTSMPPMDRLAAWYKIITESYRGEPNDSTRRLRRFTKPLRVVHLDPFLKIDAQLYQRSLLSRSTLSVQALIAPHTLYLRHAWMQNLLVLQWLLGHVLLATLALYQTLRTIRIATARLLASRRLLCSRMALALCSPARTSSTGQRPETR